MREYMNLIQTMVESNEKLHAIHETPQLSAIWTVKKWADEYLREGGIPESQVEVNVHEAKARLSFRDKFHDIRLATITLPQDYDVRVRQDVEMQSFHSDYTSSKKGSLKDAMRTVVQMLKQVDQENKDGDGFGHARWSARQER
jgi:hypothetical protein